MDGVKSLSLFLHDVQRFVHLSEADHIFLLSNWTSVTWVPHQDGSRISNTDFTLLQGGLGIFFWASVISAGRVSAEGKLWLQSAECRDFWSRIELHTHLLFLQLTWLPSFPGWAKCVERVGAVQEQVALWLNWAPSPPPHTQSRVSKWEPMLSLSFIHGCTWTTLVFNKSRCQMSLEATCQRLCSEVAFRGDAVDLQEEGPISLMTQVTGGVSLKETVGPDPQSERGSPFSFSFAFWL